MTTLPSSPGVVEKSLYLNPKRRQLYTIGIFSTLVLIAGNLLFVYSNPGLWPYLIFLSLLAFYLGISYFIGIFGETFNLAKHISLVSKWIDRAEDASVDVFLPICGEPRALLENTWHYVRQLRLAHNRVKVHVLNDRHSHDLEVLARVKYGFNYITRDTNELKKAGNLRNAFAQTDGDFILILDADFCPRKDILIETLPYMFEDERVGIVQTPQFFRVDEGQNWLERGAAMIQELFYRLIQVNRGTYNGSICVGTCALYRRSALEPFGGTAPIEYSEDVHTGFQIISTGGVIKYLPINLSMGICPEQIKAYFTQQYRWSMGSISLFFSKKFWLAPISALQRICYLSGMFYYITTGLFVLVGPLPSLYLLGFHPEKIMWFNLLASIPSLLYGTVYLYTWTSLGRDEPWYVRAKAVINSLSARHVAYFAHLFAITDYLRGSLEEWKPTNTVNKSSRFAVFKAFYLWHTLFVFLGSVSLVGKALLDGYEPKNFLLILFFIGFNFLVAFNPLKDLLVGERD